MRLALADADSWRRRFSHINAHGTSTPLNDLADPAAVRDVFDGRSCP